MSDKDEIEKLRACIIIDRAIIQAILEELPVSILESLNSKLPHKLEQFTARATYSTMPEAYVSAHIESTNSWVSLAQETLDRRLKNPLI